MMLQTLVLLVAFVSAAAEGTEQVRPSATVENTGEATVYATPTEVTFWLNLSAQKASIAEAMAVAVGFEKELRGKLMENALSPVDVNVSAPVVAAMDQKTVHVSAKLTFAAGPFTQPDTGPNDFALVCDRVGAIALALGCTITGPLLDATGKEPIVRDAIAAATANAYPGAETVAETLGAAVFEVVRVEILDVIWNRAEEGGTTYPTLRSISCTARVKAVYALNP